VVGTKLGTIFSSRRNPPGADCPGYVGGGVPS